MACLNTNGFLAPTGVGLFGCGNDQVVSARTNDAAGKAAKKITAVNVAGWIPGVSLVAGVASIVLGVAVQRGGSKAPKSFSAALITRGVVQIAQLGILLAPFDIGFSLVRLVREHMKHRVPHHMGRVPHHMGRVPHHT